MKKFYKIACFVLCFIFITAAVPASAVGDSIARYELGFEANAESYLLVSLDTGEVIFEKNSSQQYIPASLTKMLTAYTVLKYVDDIDNTMVTAPRYIYDELFGMGGSTADIRRGETLSVRELLYALMLPSANEAANILADYVGNGSIPNFCMMMNNEAKKLGCKNTNFTNAHGLFTDNHYTSAWDLYLIAKALYEIPGFMDIVTTNTYQMPANSSHTAPYYIQSTIKIQNRAYSNYYRSYVSGIKTGSLDEIGQNFVTVCEKNGEKYIFVVIGAKPSADENKPAFITTAQIMDYFFDNYTLKSANSLSLPVTEIQLKYAKDTDTLLLYPDSQVMSILPNEVSESSFQKVMNIPQWVGAPVNKGDAIGTVDYYLAGQKVGTSQLISAVSVERSTLMFLVEKFSEFYHSLYFKVLVCVTAVLVAVYVAYAYMQFKKHEKMNKVHRSRR